MKKVILLLLSVVMFSCGKEQAEKPEHLLSEDEMVNIFYDLSLLQAIQSYQPQAITNNGVDANNYVYKKYKIDSLTFVQNNKWYTGNLEQYQRMQQRVTEKLKKQKDVYTPKKDSVAAPVYTNVPGAQAKRDSVQKSLLNKRRFLKK